MKKTYATSTTQNTGKELRRNDQKYDRYILLTQSGTRAKGSVPTTLIQLAIQLLAGPDPKCAILLYLFYPMIKITLDQRTGKENDPSSASLLSHSELTFANHQHSVVKMVYIHIMYPIWQLFRISHKPINVQSEEKMHDSIQVKD